MPERVAAVVIGRNEGDRLLRCLRSLQGKAHPIVYVDSGSSDDSIRTARASGVEVLELDLSVPFTAARARNTGIAKVDPEIPFVQVIDGDCELDPNWIDRALNAIGSDTRIAVVCGRRRERNPNASYWNRLVDFEWDTPLGETKACGGDALIRRKAFDEVGGYREDLIAGEEPEMCFRLRQVGWRIVRVGAEMTLHDVAMTRFSQWWLRSRRAGHAFAQGALLHGARSAERYYVGETMRALAWGAILPLGAMFGAILEPWLLLLLLAFPAQVLRLHQRGHSWLEAIFLVVGKFPEAQGAIGAIGSWLAGRRHKLIEYK